MKRMILRLLQAACFMLIPFIAQSVLACQCSAITTPYGAYEESAYVFTGKVVGVKDDTGKEIIQDETVDRSQQEGDRYYVFEVQELFKGAKSSQVTAAYNLNMCNFGLSKDETYLIYAYADENGTFITTSYCWRTRGIDEAQDDIYFLRGLLAKKPEPRIYGSLHLYDKDRADSPYVYLQGIKIIARNGKKRFETLTDKNGLYSFNKLPDGRYKVYPEISKEYVTDWHYTYQEIVLGKTDEFPGSFFSKFIGENAYSEFQIKRKQP